jgi:hypothetical protein
MKHTLKTLLTTTLLILPTAFGSAAHPDDAARLDAAHAGAVVVTATARPALTIARLPIEAMMRVTGGVTRSFDKTTGAHLPKKLVVGFLGAKALSSLCRISRRFNRPIQPILDWAKIWRQTDVIPRLLQPAQSTPFAQKKFRFLRVRTDASFDYILDIAL